MLGHHSVTLRSMPLVPIFSPDSVVGERRLVKKFSLFVFFQLHVLSFTLHRLLEKLSSSLNPGDLDPGLQDIVEVRVSPITLF